MDCSLKMDQIIDSDKALAGVGGNKAFLIEVIHAFIEDCGKHLRDIDLAIDAGDAVTIRRAAHTIKGSADVIAAPVTREAARALEHHGREARWEEIPEAAVTLKEALEQLLPELNKITEG